MTEPAPKNKVVEQALDDMTKLMFGISRTDAITKDICVRCKQPQPPEHQASWSEMGRREFTISGICEPCWDKMFPPEDPDTGIRDGDPDVRL